MPRPTRPAQNPISITLDEDELQSVDITWELHQDNSDPPVDVLTRVAKVTWKVPTQDGTFRRSTTRVYEGDDASFDAMVDNLLTKAETLT